ncbi:MFS transporter [Jiangella asiatica]|uniref:MFS transporter n=1 Tax=Jiangella asiatica TaxID=2530372 RepID=UPI0013A5CFED|nr:MFS transporter [Jiangella asiatica]
MVDGRVRRRAREALRRSLQSLRVRNYRLFFGGHAISVAGTWMQRVAQDWLVFEITGSAVAIGAAMALQFGPILLLGIWGGVIADRVDRRIALLVTQAVQLVLALVLGTLVVAGIDHLWIVMAFSLLLGLATVVDQPVRQAFVAELVDRDSIANAQVLNSAAHNLGKVAGPVAAGGVIAWQGAGAAFLVNAASFLPLLVNLARMDGATLRRPPRLVRGRGQARAGLRYVRDHPDLRIAMVLLLVVCVLGQNFRVVFPLVGAELFDGGAGTYGTLMAMLGLGAMLAAVFTAARQTATVRGLIVAAAGFGLAGTALAISPTLGLALAVTVVVGIANFSFNTLARTVLQLVADQAMHGRVLALHGVVFLGSTPIGGLLLGWVCERWGARVGLLVGGLSALAVAAVAERMFRRAHSRPPMTPSTVEPAGKASGDQDH